MTKIESVKEAIIRDLGIKNIELLEEKLNSLAADMLKRKYLLKKLNIPGKKNVQELSEKYKELTGKISNKIKEINELL